MKLFLINASLVLLSLSSYAQNKTKTLEVRVIDEDKQPIRKCKVEVEYKFGPTLHYQTNKAGVLLTDWNCNQEATIHISRKRYGTGVAFLVPSCSGERIRTVCMLSKE